MSDLFSDMANGLEPQAQATEAQASPENKTDLAPSAQANADTETPTQGAAPPSQTAVSQAIAELDKMDKFKLDGQEWTLKDLKAAIMRQKDYTQKTQTLAEERKSLQEEKRFHENLAWDLDNLRKNPALVHEFLKVYPQSFHKYAEEFLKGNQPEQSPQQSVQPAPQVDVNLLSRLTALEKRDHDALVKQNETFISDTMKSLSEKYPRTKDALAQEIILARVYEAQSKNTPVTQELFETIHAQVDKGLENYSKAEYGSLVKKQTEVNKQGRDVGAGGGAVGRAPVKFTRFDDLAKHAELISKGGG